MADYVLAIDQGTTSSRAIIFDKAGSIISTGQLEHEQIFPKAGWVEHDPAEIWRNTGEVIGQALGKGEPHPARHRRRRHHEPARDGRGLGPPHRRARVQRDRLAGHPHPVDRRPARGGRRRRAVQGRRSACRSPPTSRAPKIVWILENVPGRAREGRGRRPALRHHRHLGALEPHRRRRRRRARDGCHEREPHDVHGPRDACSWDDDILAAFGVPALDAARDPVVVGGLRPVATRALAAARDADRRHPRRPAGRDLRPGGLRAPARRRTPTAPATSSSSTPGRRSSTRGTGCSPPSGTSSATQPVHYALEGSIAVTGSLIQWLRDNLGLISSAVRGRGARERRRGQRRRVLRAGVLRACSRRTGVPTRAARSWASPAM